MYCKKRPLRTILILSLMFTFILPAGAALAYSGVPGWFSGLLGEVDSWHLIPDSFDSRPLDAPVTRGEFAEIVVRGFVSAGGVLPDGIKESAFTDRPGVYGELAAALGLISGYPDGTFQADQPIRREELFVMISRLLDGMKAPQVSGSAAGAALDEFRDGYQVSSWAQYAAGRLVGMDVISGTGGGLLEPRGTTSRAQALTMALKAVSGRGGTPVSSQTMERVLYLAGRLSVPYRHDGAVSTASRGGETTRSTSDPMVQLGNNPVKYAAIFGSATAPRYQSASEAIKHMVTIRVPVWTLSSSGQKVSSEKSLTIHKALAGTVLEIFREIHNGPEKFPIKDLGGYAWRSSTTSEHRWGLAIDLNFNENYMISSTGAIQAGSFWKPGENPYSIPADGDVVRAFRKYGFSWGGDAWRSRRDYMHFSFLGQ